MSTLVNRGFRGRITLSAGCFVLSNCGIRASLQFIHRMNSAPQMRDYNRASNNEADGQRFQHLGLGNSLLEAPRDVVGHAVIAAQHKGRDQAEQLLGTRRQGALVVDPRIKREKPADIEVETEASRAYTRGASALRIRSFICSRKRRNSSTLMEP